MNKHALRVINQLSDRQLVEQVKVLAAHERESTATLIAHLAVMDARRLFLEEGCPSLFAYCVEVLNLSEDATCGRIAAARAAQKYPIILDLLADGSVNLTTIRLLAPRLTPENHHEILEAAKHLKRQEVEELMARLWPLPDVASSIRKLPAPTPAEAATLAPPEAEEGDRPGPTVEAVPPRYDSFALIAPERRAVIAPLAPERYKVEFTASAETRAKLLQAQELLRFQIPDGDVGQIIDRALTALLKTLTKQKFAAVGKPHDDGKTGHALGGVSEHEIDPPAAARVSSLQSRHIPAEVKRVVWERDDGQCAFVSPDGRRCAARTFIEFHHVKPFAAGGEATVENLQLRCHAHNDYEAALYFGGSWVRECDDELVSNRVEPYPTDHLPHGPNGPPV